MDRIDTEKAKKITWTVTFQTKKVNFQTLFLFSNAGIPQYIFVVWYVHYEYRGYKESNVFQCKKENFQACVFFSNVGVSQYTCIVMV